MSPEATVTELPHIYIAGCHECDWSGRRDMVAGYLSGEADIGFNHPTMNQFAVIASI